MFVTKNAAELCVLLIEELYGQLPARIFGILLSKGRANVKQLGQDSSMNPRLVRHGLSVLIQQNLIFHHTDPDTMVTRYDANPEAAYNLVRSGKILDVIHRGYGEEARDLVHMVMLNGQMSVSAIMESMTKNSKGNAHANGHVNGDSSETAGPSDDEHERSQRIFELLAHLIAVGIVEPLTMRMLQVPEDVRAELDREIMKDYPTGLRGTKQKNEFNAKSGQAWREVLDEGKSLKRELEPDYLYASAVKRRKLSNGSRPNGFAAMNRDNIIDPDTILHVNYKKCLVELRNHRLSHYAEDSIGPVTAQVYAAMLAALGKKLTNCQLNAEDQDGEVLHNPSVTTLEIYELLRPSVDLFAGIGKCDPDAINTLQAEKIQTSAPGYDADQDANGAVFDDEEEDEGNGDVQMGNGIHVNGHYEDKTQVTQGQNGTREPKVKFAERVPSRAERIQQMRQHLLVLAESNLGFARHCGTRDQGEWTVDFEVLIPKLQLVEIDALIEESFGRQGLRLVKVLRAKGKVDDRTLPTFALMKKSDVYLKMTEMELQGYLEVQEVPRDNNRTASRTLFLWFFDQTRTMTRVLDDTYKAMARHLQRLEVERRKKKNVLSVAQRKDVQGMEEEKLRGDIYNEYQEFLDIESKLLGQVGRLDDLVGVFRDF